MSTFAIFATVFVGSKIFAYEIVSSGPAKSAAAVVPSEDSEKLQLRLNSDPPNGNLKPPIYTEPEWVSSIDRATHTDNTTEGVIQTSAEVEVTIPPPLTELDAPVSPEAIIENESSIEEKVIEPKVDIRPPVVSSDSEEDDEDRIEPCWTDPFVDDHLLLWRENREELELLFNNGNGFGMTTLGFDAKITGGDGPLWANCLENRSRSRRRDMVLHRWRTGWRILGSRKRIEPQGDSELQRLPFTGWVGNEESRRIATSIRTWLGLRQTNRLRPLQRQQRSGRHIRHALGAYLLIAMQ